MASLALVNDVLSVGMFRKEQVPLSSLRLAFLIVPGNVKLYVVQTNQSRSFVNLDPMDDAEFEKTASALEGLLSSGSGLGDIQVLIADFKGRSFTFSVKDVKKSGIGFVGAWRASRAERQKRVREWLKGNPAVLLKGILWWKATASRAGYAKGKHLVRWEDVETVQVETVNGLACHFYVLPKGVGGGTFSFAKGRYGISIPPSKGDLYTAECTFWRLLRLSAFSQGETAPSVESGRPVVSIGEDGVNWFLAILLLLFFFPVGILYLYFKFKSKGSGE